jgi:hypothetical protein
MTTDIEHAGSASLAEQQALTKSGNSSVAPRSWLGAPVGQLMASRISDLFRGYVAEQHICQGPDPHYDWACVASSAVSKAGGVLARCPECDQMLQRGRRR